MIIINKYNAANNLKLLINFNNFMQKTNNSGKIFFFYDYKTKFARVFITIFSFFFFFFFFSPFIYKSRPVFKFSINKKILLTADLNYNNYTTV